MLALVPFKITTTPEFAGTVGVEVTDGEGDTGEGESEAVEGKGKAVEGENEVEKIEDVKKDEIRLVDKEDEKVDEKLEEETGSTITKNKKISLIKMIIQKYM